MVLLGSAAKIVRITNSRLPCLQSLLNYMPHVLSCPTCIRASRALCLTCPCVLWPTCSCALRVSHFTGSRVLRASWPTSSFVSRALCLTCSRASLVWRTFVPQVSCGLRFLVVLVFRAILLLLLVIPHLLQVFQA